MFLQQHYQNAYVTRNIERAIEEMRTRYGVQEFLRYEGDSEVMTLQGRRINKVKLALGWAGALQYELIEPVAGTLELYHEGLSDSSLTKFHHICMRVNDGWDEFRKGLDQQELPIVLEGGTPGHLQFVYVDARKSLGHYLEYCWMTPARWAAMGGG